MKLASSATNIDFNIFGNDLKLLFQKLLTMQSTVIYFYKLYQAIIERFSNDAEMASDRFSCSLCKKAST